MWWGMPGDGEFMIDYLSNMLFDISIAVTHPRSIVL